MFSIYLIWTLLLTIWVMYEQDCELNVSDKVALVLWPIALMAGLFVISMEYLDRKYPE